MAATPAPRSPLSRLAHHVDPEDAGPRAFSTAAAVKWLVSMRWHAVVGQLAALLLAKVALGRELPYGPLVALAVVAALSNLALALGSRRAVDWPPHTTGVLLLVDALLLTCALALVGAVGKPFATLYLALVAIGAFVLDRRYTVALLLFVVVANGWLVVREGVGAEGKVAVAIFAATAAVITAVVRRLGDAVRTRQDALVRAERASSRAEAVASLGTLAAGAAHELATPLGTIAVVANDLERTIDEDPARAVEDAALVRAEIERCRTIIARMAARAGDQIGELATRVPLREIHAEIVASLPCQERSRLASTLADRVDEVWVPRAGLVQALASLVANGLASDARAEVAIRASTDGDEIVFEVVDDGPGVPPHVLSRLGDPFLTTKAPGEGMGLGVFLCHAFVDAWKGSLVFDSSAAGTRVRLALPVAARCARAA